MTPRRRPVSQVDFVKQFFLSRPMRAIPHAESKRDIENSYQTMYGRRIEDVDRAIRQLHQEGLLVKVRNGVYMFDPDFDHDREDLEDFSAEDRAAVLARDGFQCVVCDSRRAEGAELHVDHIRPKNRGGRAIQENGQTLCSRHNFLKKTTGQMSFGKRVFVELRKTARASSVEGSSVLEEFCTEVLAVYERYQIDDQLTEEVLESVEAPWHAGQDGLQRVKGT